MPRTKSPIAPLHNQTTQDGKKTALVANDWTYSTAIKLFNLNDSVPRPLAALALAPMHPDKLLAGYLCQAARELLGTSQAWLWSQATVSRKTINDFENGFIQPKSALVMRLRQALEAAGASFVEGHETVGVIVYKKAAGTITQSL